MKTIKIGQKVIWRGSWGKDLPKEVTIKNIELCEKENQKEGIDITEVWVNLKDRCVFGFNENTHWAYGYQIELIEERPESDQFPDIIEPIKEIAKDHKLPQYLYGNSGTASKDFR